MRGEAVIKRPDDLEQTEALLVYADWLQERRDPRGRLIAIQHALEQQRARNGVSSVLLREEADLLRAYRRRLLGPALEGELWDGTRSRSVWLRWKLGFVEQATLDVPGDQRELGPRLLSAIAEAPSSALMRRLELRGSIDEPELIALLAARPIPSLRSLVVEGDGTVRAALGDLGPLLAVHRKLELLELTGDPVQVSGAREHVAHLVLRTEGLERETVEHLGSGRWPALERLDLWVGRALGEVELREMLDPRRMPRLRRLGLHAAELSNCIEELAHPRVLTQLKELDLADCTLACRPEFRFRRGAFGHLDEVCLPRAWHPLVPGGVGRAEPIEWSPAGRLRLLRGARARREPAPPAPAQLSLDLRRRR